MIYPPAPPMETVRHHTGQNGRKVVSLFAGGGGSSLGYRLAGYSVVWASEFISIAAQTYALNKDDATVLSKADIRDVPVSHILDETNMDVGELDVLDGSPPCSSFSTIGRGASEWGNAHRYGVSEDVIRTDDLFFEYARILRGLQPKVFVAENVTGLVKGVSRGYFKIIHDEFTKAGYRVKARVVNAAWLGVPQNRKRLIFVGVRDDLRAEPVHPKPLTHLVTMEECFPYMTRIGTAPALKDFVANPACAFVPPNIPCPTIVTLVNEGVGLCITRNTGGVGVGPRGAQGDVLVDPETGRSLEYPERELWRGKNRRIMAKGERRSTPGGVRRYTLKELRRIFAYPEDFRLAGSYQDRWERLARSVPPLMMKAVADSITEEVFQPSAV